MANTGIKDKDDGRVAVLDVGKTNVKISAVSLDGDIFETVSAHNPVLPGPPWRHHDLDGLSEWIFSTLAELCRRYPITHVATCGHGAAGVLTGADPDGPGGGALLPMIDYEQPYPAHLADAYVPLSGTFYDRGSAIMGASTHQARQLFWMQNERPDAVAAARWYHGLPQYWSWRLSGAAVSEYSYMAAQTHFWNAIDQKFAPIVALQNWQRLIPPFAHAWQTIGPVRPALVRRYGLPDSLSIHAGAHDSSVNFYRYQATGLSDFAIVSTGTWVVALADGVKPELLDEHKGMTLNSDVYGRPLGGALTMGGREFSHVAGVQEAGAFADINSVARLIEQGTMALPIFGIDPGQFPGSVGRGRIAGPAPKDAQERLALAVLYVALLTVECIDVLDSQRLTVLDGGFLHDPLYAGLIAALRPHATTMFNAESYGCASGAALLCSHTQRTKPAHLSLGTPSLPKKIPGLAGYAARWREAARQLY
jgi:sugar (pentulose or hexulose) kinase